MNPKFSHLSIFIAALFAIVSCSPGKGQDEGKQETRKSIVADFIKDITYLESVEANSEIEAFEQEATAVADRMIPLDKDNMASVLVTAKHYKAMVITVEDHTIVKVLDFSDCQPSGSWGTCMPLGEGYVKKGGLIKQRDYINNIIGAYDSQQRTAYLFN